MKQFFSFDGKRRIRLRDRASQLCLQGQERLAKHRNGLDMEALLMLLESMRLGDCNAAWELAAADGIWSDNSDDVKIHLIVWAASCGSSDAALWMRDSPLVTDLGAGFWDALVDKHLASPAWRNPLTPPPSVLVGQVAALLLEKGREAGIPTMHASD